MKEMIFNSIKETQSFAADFAKTIPAGTVIGLIGDLGTGKTTFVRFFINNLENKKKIKNSDVLSPTFNIVYNYNLLFVYPII